MTYAEPISVPVPNRYGAMCTEVYDLDKPPGSLADVPRSELALASVGFEAISVGAQPDRPPGRSSRILNFEARRPF